MAIRMTGSGRHLCFKTGQHYSIQLHLNYITIAVAMIEMHFRVIMNEIKASEPIPIDRILDSKSLYMIESKKRPVNPDRLKINR